MKMLNSLSLGKNSLNIRQFKPGHYMILDNNSIGDVKKYWTFQSRNKFIQYFYRHKYYDNLNLCEDNFHMVILKMHLNKFVFHSQTL